MSKEIQAHIDINRAIRECIQSGVLLEEYYIPHKIDATWNVYLSERNRAKTTTWLLVGLACYVQTGTVTHYIRTSERMIAESKISTIYDTIRKSGYISILSAGKWNSIRYLRTRREWRLCNVDDMGDIKSEDTKACTRVMCTDQSDEYKSGYQCPDGDLIIYDEFQNDAQRRGDFIRLLNIVSTVFRERRGCKIVLLSNTIDKGHEYFDDLELRDFISCSDAGDSTRIVTGKGTSVYCELLDRRATSANAEVIREYYGFKAKGIESITGEGWQVEDVPRIDPAKRFKSVARNIYIYTRGIYIQLEVVDVDDKRYIYAHKAIDPSKHKDAVIYTHEMRCGDGRYRYHLGGGSKLDVYLRNKFERREVYYANNDVGIKVAKYIANKD